MKDVEDGVLPASVAPLNDDRENGFEVVPKEGVPNERVPDETALNPNAGFASFAVSTESFELDSVLVPSLPSFVKDMLPLRVLDPAEPKTELGVIENVGPVLEDCVVPMLLDGFAAGVDTEESEEIIGFATDGVEKENDGAALGRLLFVNLKTFSDGALVGEAPNGDPAAALELELTVGVGVGVVLPGGGPNLEARVVPDFSAKDAAFLGDALFASGRLSPDGRSNKEPDDCDPCTLETVEFPTKPLETEESLLSGEGDVDGAGLEVADRV